MNEIGMEIHQYLLHKSSHNLKSDVACKWRLYFVNRLQQFVKFYWSPECGKYMWTSHEVVLFSSVVTLQCNLFCALQLIDSSHGWYFDLMPASRLATTTHFLSFSSTLANNERQRWQLEVRLFSVFPLSTLQNRKI